jgi:toxin secretion/phage lysis holin
VIKEQILYYWHQACQLLGLKALGVLLLAALAPQALTLHVLLFLFCVDFATGVLVARQMHRLSSAGMRRGLTKLFIYICFITIIAMAEHSVLGTQIGTMGAIGLLVCTELVSIIENLVWLGLPVPYASKVLSLVNSKTNNFGFKTDVGDADVSLPYTRDVYQIVSQNAANLKSQQLAQQLKIYCAVWYGFIRDLTPDLFRGTTDLGWARLKATIERAQVDCAQALAKADIEGGPTIGAVAKEAAERFCKASNKISMAKDVDHEQRVTQVRDQAMLMCYRVVGEIESLDRKAPPAH